MEKFNLVGSLVVRKVLFLRIIPLAMNHKLEASRILALFPILNQRLRMLNKDLAIKHVKESIEMLKKDATIEDYEQILKIIENENN